MGRAAVIGAVIAIIATGLVAALGLMGVSHIPIAEYLLLPGGMVAWAYKGDNYRSSSEFLLHAIAFGVPLNGLAGATVGALAALTGAKLRGRRSRS